MALRPEDHHIPILPFETLRRALTAQVAHSVRDTDIAPLACISNGVLSMVRIRSWPKLNKAVQQSCLRQARAWGNLPLDAVMASELPVLGESLATRQLQECEHPKDVSFTAPVT